MTQVNYTDVTILLDRSGSMETIKSATEEGLNGFITEQRKLPGKCLLSAVLFDSYVVSPSRPYFVDSSSIAFAPPTEWLFEAVPIKDAKGIRLNPRGSTPLFDAVGDVIERTGKRLAASCEGCRPDRVVIAIVTDGQENASIKYNLAQIKQMIEHQQSVHKWDFVFLGANINAMEVGTSIGIYAVNTMTYDANYAGTQVAYKSLSASISNTRSGGSAALVDDNS